MIRTSRQPGFALEDLKEGSTSMNRTVVFLLLGPSLVALAVLMVAVAIAGPIDDAFVALCAMAAFLLTLPVSAGAPEGIPDRSYRHGYSQRPGSRLVRDDVLTDSATRGHERGTLRGLLVAAANGLVLALVE
jgi:hypothetical protein